MCTDRSAHPALMVAAQDHFTLVVHGSHKAGTDVVFTVDHCRIVALHSASSPQEGVVQQLDAGHVISICWIRRGLSPRSLLHPASWLPSRCELPDRLADQGSAAICLCSAWRLL
jgi:hypothetical protein